MAYKLQLKRGLTSALPTGSAGEPLFTTDTNDLYIGTGAANQRYQKYIASGSSSQFLKGDGTLDSTTYTPTSRTLTINGTSYDLSANRTWNVGTVTTAAATTAGQVAFFNGATVITSVSGLYFDGVDKLGIATTSPAYNLDVTGTARMTGNLTAASFIKSGGTSSQYLMADGSTSTLTNPVTGTGTTNYLPKWTSGTAIGNSVLQENSGSIGINGAAVPDLGDTRLQINATTYSSLSLKSTSVNALFRSHEPNGILYVGNISNHPIGFLVNDAEQMRLTSTGLGIGTTSPQSTYKLTISGTDTIFPAIYFENTTNSQAYSIRATGTNFVIRDNTSGNDKITLTNTGNLGLGVVPSAWSSIFNVIEGPRGSVIAFQNNGNSLKLGSNFYFTGANYNYINTNAAARYDADAEHRWYLAPSGTAGNAISFTQAMTLDASGRLGVGTTSPAYKLDIAGFANSTSGFRVTDGTIDNRISWASGNVGFFGTISNHPIAFYTNEIERLRITSGGNVGIGTTSPANRLQVNVSSNDTGGYIDASYPLYLRNTSTTSNSYVGIYFGGGFGVGATIETQFPSPSTSDEGILKFSTRNSSGSIAERLRITSGGLLGLGTTSPANKMDVVGDGIRTSADQSTSAFLVLAGTATEGRITVSSYGGFQPMTFYTGGSERLRITSGGFVGIGGSAPSSKLSVYTSNSGSSPTPIVRLENTGTGYQARMILTDGSTADGIIAFQGGVTAATQYLGFGIGSSPTQMVLNGEGNVLIGTSTNGGSRLRVVGLPTSATGLSAGDIWNDGGTLKIV